jgi:uncharacterized protein
MSEMMTGPDKLKARAAGKKKQFRSVVEKINRLKGHDADTLFHRFYDRFSRETDCTSCANCCRKLGPRLTYTDIKRLAAGLKTGTSDFFKKYISTDEDGDYVFKSLPCPFLDDDNLCSVYPVRPAACRDYPHTGRKNITSILEICLRNTGVCPVVYKIFDALSDELK